LVLSFSCPVLSGDGWAEVHGRAGLWGAGDWPCWDFTGAGAGDPRGVTWGPGLWAGWGEPGGAGIGSDWDRQSWQCPSFTSLKAAPALARAGEDNTEKPLQWSLQVLQVPPYSSSSAHAAPQPVASVQGLSTPPIKSPLGHTWPPPRGSCRTVAEIKVTLKYEVKRCWESHTVQKPEVGLSLIFGC